MTGSRESKDYDWAFSLRAFSCDSSSDDSEDDGLPLMLNKKQPEMLLEDFDLGSREEAVSYKPNPFSIAKINASYRSARNRGSEAKSAFKVPQNGHPGKACGLVQTKIDDVLKKQESKSLKKVDARKNSRPPGASDAYSETIIAQTKQPRPKMGPTGSTDRAFVLPQNVEISNANTDSEESSTVYSGFDPSLGRSLVSENAHTLAPTSRLYDAPACMIPSPSDNGYVKPEDTDLRLPFPEFSSPLRSNARSISPKHGSPPLTLSTSGHLPRFVGLHAVDDPARSNSGQTDKKCSDQQVKQEFGFSPGIPIPGRNEAHIESFYLSEDRASPPSIPSLGQRNQDPEPAANTSKPAPLPMVTKRQTMAQWVPTTALVPLQRSAGDAYSFSGEDPDENWSTLRTRKKKIPKNKPTSSFRAAKSFRLPGLLAPRNMVKMETDDTSRKRIMTYLPPNRASLDELTRPSVSKLSYSISRVQDENKTPALPSLSTSYPSLTHPRISRLSQVYPVSQARQAISVSQPVLAPATREQTIEVYRPPSPPTSDPPVMSESNSADVRIQFDLRVVRGNCPGSKR